MKLLYSIPLIKPLRLLTHTYLDKTLTLIKLLDDTVILSEIFDDTNGSIIHKRHSDSPKHTLIVKNNLCKVISIFHKDKLLLKDFLSTLYRKR